MENVRKIVFVLAIIFVFVFTIFGVDFLKKYMIFDKISKNLLKQDFSNYQMEMYSDVIDKNVELENFEHTSKEEVIYKSCGNVKIQDSLNRSIIDSQDVQYVVYNDDKMYIENDTVEPIDDTIVKSYFEQWNENKTTKDKLELALKSKIETVTFENKECYSITLKNENSDIPAEKVIIYIDKESLLKVGEMYIYSDGERFLESYVIEFGTQKEEDYEINKLLEGYTKFSDNSNVN